MIRILEQCRDTRLRREALVGGAALALALLPFEQARAGVEHITTTSNCTNHILGATGTLTVMAGTMQFEVYADPLGGDASDGAIDQELPHRNGGDREEMRSIAPIEGRSAN